MSSSSPARPRSYTTLSLAPEATRGSESAVPVGDATAYTVPQLWHLLSLDAPTVAALWTVFLAECAGVRLPWSCAPSLFLAVWILYATDRLLDARPLPGGDAPPGLEARHRFHRRHRSRFMPAIGAGALLLLVLLPSLGARTLALYALLTLALAAWLLLVHARLPATNKSRRLPKELVVGPFFAAAVVVPTVARAPALCFPLLSSVLLFAGVCALNCLLLSAWEHRDEHTGEHSDESGGEPAGAHRSTRWAARHLVALGMSVTSLNVLVALVTRRAAFRGTAGRFADFDIACGLAAVLLLLLHTRRGHISALTLRVAGDAVLLTPLLFPGWLRFFA